MNTVIRKIGDSEEGVVLPRELLERLHLKAGDTLVLSEEEGSITLTRSNDAHHSQLEVALGIMDRYRAALQKLAE